jgi:class 3 adenylate cyclase
LTPRISKPECVGATCSAVCCTSNGELHERVCAPFSHDALARAQLERYRGREVKMTGDGLLATFDGPARAVTCAGAIGRAVRTLGLAVRAAVHTGEVELRDGDIGGIAVHIASRVMGLAQPNEVLVSSTVKDLVAGAEIRFEDRRVQSLRGVPGQWHLFAAYP